VFRRRGAPAAQRAAPGEHLRGEPARGRAARRAPREDLPGRGGGRPGVL